MSGGGGGGWPVTILVHSFTILNVHNTKKKQKVINQVPSARVRMVVDKGYNGLVINYGECVCVGGGMATNGRELTSQVYPEVGAQKVLR